MAKYSKKAGKTVESAMRRHEEEGGGKALDLRAMRRVALAVSLAFGIVPPPPAQQAARPAPAAATRVVRGVVVSASGERPLGRARITAMKSGTQAVSATVLTDAGGAFAFALPADTPFALRFQKAGYATTTLPIGEARAGVPTELRAAMARGAVITGRVLFDNESQVFGSALRVTVRRLGSASAGGQTSPLSSVTVDDRGEYRVSGLTAGRYAIATRVGSGSPSIPPVVVDVTAGAEVAGVDVVFQSRLLPLTALPIATPRPSTGGAVIRGRVSARSGEPLVVSVTVVAGARRISATSSADGRYAVTGIPAGTVHVESTTTGYVRSRYGTRDAQLPGTPITVKDDDEIDGIDLVLARTSAVSGTIVDEAGEPIEGAFVQLLGIAGGGWQAPAAGTSEAFASSTPRSDDRGRFRISGVNPGSYFLVASLPGEVGGLSSGPRLAYVPSYYPGTPDLAAAARITVGVEQDLQGFTIPIRRVVVARLEGIATDSGGRPLTGQIRLSRAPASGPTQHPRQTPVGAHGEFVFADVRPGEYVVHAVTGTGPSGPEFAAQPIVVSDTDPPPLLLRTSPGSRVSGRIVLDGPPDAVLWGYASNVVPVGFSLSATASATSSGAFSSGTTFMLSGLGGSARLVFSTPDEKWFLKSILIDGADIVDTPFEFGIGGRAYTDVEVVFSPDGASIEGRVNDERGLPVPHPAIVVFGVDRETWFPGSRWVKMAPAERDGAFKVTALPPGDYWIAALDRPDGSGDLEDPDVLQEIASRAVRLTLGARQSQMTTLRVIRR